MLPLLAVVGTRYTKYSDVSNLCSNVISSLRSIITHTWHALVSFDCSLFSYTIPQFIKYYMLYLYVVTVSIH